MVKNPIYQALAGTITVMALVLGLFFMLQSSSGPAYADSHTAGPTPVVASCSIIKQAGINIQFECTDNLGNIIPAGQITLEPEVIVSEISVPGPTVTVKVPGPVKVIRPPRATTTKTVTLPRATATATVTRTLPPKPRATRTLTSAPETTTVTATATVTPRQDTPRDGSIEPGRDFFSFDIDPSDDNLTAGEAGLGALALVGLVTLFFLGLYSGYYLGFRNKEKDDTDFMRALRDSIMIRGH